MRMGNIDAARLMKVGMVVGGLCLAVGCSPKPDDDEPEPDAGSETVAATKTIGAEGGTVEVEGASLEVPAGAVDSEVEITVEQTDTAAPEGLEAYSPVYRFGPEGLNFATPVEVRLPVGEAGQEDRVVLFWTVPEDEQSGEMPEYRSLATSRVDGRAVATVDHFSGGFAGRPRSCRGGSCPGAAQCVAGACMAIDCENGRKNGLETDVDCGGPHCGGCHDGKRCEVDTDCRGGQCLSSGRCLTGGDADAGMDATTDTGGMDSGRDTASMDVDSGADTDGAQADAGDSGADASDVDAGLAGGPVRCYGSGMATAPGCPWVRLVGGGAKERVRGVGVGPNGEVYVAGSTTDGFDGKSYQGGVVDGFVKRYNAQGTGKWTSIFGSSKHDWVVAIAVGGQGRVTLAGSTLSSFDGASDPHQRSLDAFVVQFSKSGAMGWTRIFGTSSEDRVFAAAADNSGNSYIGGFVRESLHGRSFEGKFAGFVVKYNSSGKREWTRLIGAQVRGLATDSSGNVYAIGGTEARMQPSGQGGAFIVKFDPSGQRLWTRIVAPKELGIANGVATDGSGNAYLVGTAYKRIPGQPYNGGQTDGWGVKYDANGQRQWIRLFGVGSTRTDTGKGVATDGRGFVYFVGNTEPATGGNRDGLVAKYDLQGSPKGLLRFGAAGEESALWAAGASAGLYVSGWTDQALGGQTYLGGNNDGLLGKIDW